MRKTHIITFLVLFAALADAGGLSYQHSIDLTASDTTYWQTQTTGIVQSKIYAVSAVDRNVYWLAGASGTIIRTTNGGAAWSLINQGIIDTQDIHVIEGVSDNIAFTSTTPSDTTYIYRTTDGGSSWNKVFSQYSGCIDGIKMFNSSLGIALGEPIDDLWTILKTTNGGETWYRIAEEPPQINEGSKGYDFEVFDTCYAWFFDNKGRWYFSSHGGEDWSYSPDTSISLNKTWFLWINSYDLWLMINSHSAFRYEDTYWSNATPLPTDFFPLTGFVGAYSTREFWAIKGKIYYTSNAGSTWTLEMPNGLDKDVTLIDMVTLGSEVSAWAIGIIDTVYHYNRMLTDVIKHSEPIPRDFSLCQNYPNPFNPSTNIQFDVPASGFISLKVYDVLGKEVATLVNEELRPGKYEITWEAIGLPSGVYFYRLYAGSFIETKKLVLIR